MTIYFPKVLRCSQFQFSATCPEVKSGKSVESDLTHGRWFHAIKGSGGSAWRSFGVDDRAENVTLRELSTSPAAMKVLGNYGGWWNSLSDETKDNFIDGYTSAMDRVKRLLMGLKEACGRKSRRGLGIDAQMNHALILSLLSNECSHNKSRNALKRRPQRILQRSAQYADPGFPRFGSCA